MKRNKIIALCLMAAIFISGLNGVWLADESAATATQKKEDQLIGVLITKEYLNLFDTESYLKDHFGSMIASSNTNHLTQDSMDSSYEKKLYATLVTTKTTDSDTNELTGFPDYQFENVDGIYFMSPLITKDGENYRTISGNDKISDLFTSVGTTDAGEQLNLEGTLYMTNTVGERIFYFNPVYQTETGEVYALSGQGISSGLEQPVGTSMSQTLTAATTTAENGTETSVSSTVKVTISICPAPFEATILQMNADNQILASTTYDIDTLPDSITPLADTAYLIAETHSKDVTGTITIDRTIFSLSDETLSLFQPQPDGICIKHQIPLNWKEQSH
ncbi:MAG: hypothetical protein E7256_04710 [Lachnospiraceae bacterium]|nr:hypothetical protein [Lachnospiraceae bacterium]